MIFEKSSTRTRVSFETGMLPAGRPRHLFLSGKDSQIGRGEPVEDTARVLSRYCDGIMIRTFAQEEVETLAKYATIPVINGLTDFCHPCQVLADLMTIREHKGTLEGLKLCYVGRRQQHGQLPHRGRPEVRHGRGRRLPRGLRPRPRGAGLCRDSTRPSSLCTRDTLGRRRGRRRGLHRCVGLHGPGGRGQRAEAGLRGLSGQRRR